MLTKLLTVCLCVALASTAWAQSQQTGTIKGSVTLAGKATALHNAKIILAPLGRTTETDDYGYYEFSNLPPGIYDLIVEMPGVSAEMQSTEVKPGSVETINFQMRVAGPQEKIVVTASGRQETAFQAFQSVTTLDSLDLAEKSSTSIGEVLANEPGVAKRSFGPGSARPIIRGFDGDRVLVLQDGTTTGSLGSQSGDHGEPIDALTADRLEVVKGPATLLYGSNAIGGVVNAVTERNLPHEQPHQGLRGHSSFVTASTNLQVGSSSDVEYGAHNWIVWVGGGSQRTGDYETHIGKVENSKSRISNVNGGFGWDGAKPFFRLGFGYDNSRYGIPSGIHDPAATSEEGVEEAAVDIAMRRSRVRFDAGFRNINNTLESFRFILGYTDYSHKELEGSDVGTKLDNRLFSYRGVFDQHKRGPISGSLGFSGFHRNYKAIGAEALSPPVTQDSVAGFVLEEIDLEKVRFQFGGRIENNRYEPSRLPDRSFTGFSGAAGLHLPAWKGGAVVANYTYSYRAPALEELYNNGPHPGNLAFEIGNSNLKRERGNGIELSLRHGGRRLRGEASFFHYDLKDFVFLAPTGAVVEGLTEARYLQADTRYRGTEINLDLGLREDLWLNLGLDSVDAKLKKTGEHLPRIPPLRGRIGFEASHRGFRVRPEVVLTKDQDEIFSTETRTAGAAVFNLTASYTFPQQHLAHHFALNFFNIGDRLYRNHLSLIKEIAPEIGRGVRFAYTVRFF